MIFMGNPLMSFTNQFLFLFFFSIQTESEMAIRHFSPLGQNCLYFFKFVQINGYNLPQFCQRICYVRLHSSLGGWMTKLSILKYRTSEQVNNGKHTYIMRDDKTQFNSDQLIIRRWGRKCLIELISLNFLVSVQDFLE